MKLILAIIHDHDNEPVSQALIKAGFRVTRIASTGGFIRRGSSTLLIGVEEERLEAAIETIRQSSGQPSEPDQHRATLFVLPVEEYLQI
jgi:uncharacterized protein YaaQ